MVQDFSHQQYFVVSCCFHSWIGNENHRKFIGCQKLVMVTLHGCAVFVSPNLRLPTWYVSGGLQPPSFFGVDLIQQLGRWLWGSRKVWGVSSMGDRLCHPSCIDLSLCQVSEPTSEPWLTLHYDEWMCVPCAQMGCYGLEWGVVSSGLLRYNLFTYGLWKDKILQISSDHLYFHYTQNPTSHETFAASCFVPTQNLSNSVAVPIHVSYFKMT